jgi:hypothetical protein
VAAQQQFDWEDDISTYMLTSGTFRTNEEVPRGTLSLESRLKNLELMGFEPMILGRIMLWGKVQ